MLIWLGTSVASPYKPLYIWVKHFFGCLVYETFLWPESWRGSLHIYLLSFPRFWTLSFERFWFLFWSVVNGVTNFAWGGFGCVQKTNTVNVFTIMIMIASSTKITTNVMDAVKSVCLPFWFSVRKSETECYNHLICLTESCRSCLTLKQR